MDIIYEDNHIIVCIKPANVLSQADDTQDPDMLTILKSYLKEKYNKPGNVYLGLLHRLDRPVSGVMIFAKTSKAASRISEQIKNRHDFSKKYLAVIHGKPEAEEGEFRDFLHKDKNTNIVKIVCTPNTEAQKDNAREAILSYKILESIKHENQKLSLVSINLKTGRPHQIRVQFASRKMPLLGDAKYGEDKNTQIALWSESIELIHPVSCEQIKFAKSPPGVYPWNLFAGFPG